MRMAPLRLIAFIGMAVSVTFGCSAQLRMSPRERGEVERALMASGKTHFLRVSFYVTPFFGDGSKRLLSPVPPDEVRWLAEPNGQTVSPGAAELVLPAGTRARVTGVEFPTGWALTERLVYTPRFHPWIYVEVEGQPKEIPLVLVMRSDTPDAQTFLAEFERFLSQEDIRPKMNAWGSTVATAIAQKRALPDMVAEALEMAWGYPEKKKMSYVEGIRKEEWLYAGNRRTAFLEEGRVVRLTPPTGL